MITGADLRTTRRLAGLTLDAVAAAGGLSPSHLSRIESGERELTPATVALYERVTGRLLSTPATGPRHLPGPPPAGPPDRVPAPAAPMPTALAGPPAPSGPPLPPAGPPPADPPAANADHLRRKDLLMLAGATVVGAFVPTGAAAAGVPDGFGRDVDDLARWLAGEIWQAGNRPLHRSLVPADQRTHLGRLLASRQVVLDDTGHLRFVSLGLLEFHLACHIVDGVATGLRVPLETAVTSHTTDLVIGEFVAGDQVSVRMLDSWMRRGANPVLRVNAAGILAKTGAPQVADEVVAALRTDPAARHLYLTAVTHRVLAMPWPDAQRYAAAPDHSRADHTARLAAELRNPRDAGARWCSAVLLGGAVAGSDAVRAGVAAALAAEPSRENVRTLTALLAGADPVAA